MLSGETPALDPELAGEMSDPTRLLADEGMMLICVTRRVDLARDVSVLVAHVDAGRIEENGPACRVPGTPQSERTSCCLARVCRDGLLSCCADPGQGRRPGSLRPFASVGCSAEAIHPTSR